MQFLIKTVLSLLLYCNVIIIASCESCRTPNRQEGQCVKIRECAPLLAILQNKPISTENVDFLRRSQCGYEDKEPKVCCVQDSGKPAGDITSNLLPDPESCLFVPEDRIIGGYKAGLKEFPWMALVEYDKPTGRGFHCGASLINNRYLVTAAHCIKRIPKGWSPVSVRLGEYDLTIDKDCEEEEPGVEVCTDPPQDITIAESIVHEQYDPNDPVQANDIALFRLTRPVSFSESVKPICLPLSAEFRRKSFDGTEMTVAGWGRTENSSKSDVKLRLEVPVKTASECASVYKQRGKIDLIDSQMCAGGIKGQDSCTGDSGGPLMYLERNPGYWRWYLAGVVSFGPKPCGIKDYPGVYTKLPHYVQWVVDKLKP